LVFSSKVIVFLALVSPFVLLRAFGPFGLNFATKKIALFEKTDEFGGGMRLGCYNRHHGKKEKFCGSMAGKIDGQEEKGEKGQ